MNTVEKFRSFWDGLDGDEKRQLWRLMTALRGPDDGDMTIKFETTARVRSALFERRLSESDIHVDVSGFGPSYTRDQIRDMVEDHFRLHYEDAAAILAEQVGFKAYKDEIQP